MSQQKVEDFFLGLLKNQAREDVVSKFIINLFNIGEYISTKKVFLILISHGDRSISLRTIQEMLDFLPHLKIKETDDYQQASILISEIIFSHDWLYRFLDNKYKILISNIAFKYNDQNLINLINDSPVPVFGNRDNFFTALDSLDFEDLNNDLYCKYIISLVENNSHLVATHHLGFNQGIKKIGVTENKIIDLLKKSDLELCAKLINVLQIDLLCLISNEHFELKEKAFNLIKNIDLWRQTGWLEKIKTKKKKHKENLLTSIFNNSLFNLKNAGEPLNNDMVNYFIAQLSIDSVIELFKLESWQYKLSEKEHLYFRIKNLVSINWYDLPSHLHNKSDWEIYLDKKQIDRLIQSGTPVELTKL